MGIQTHRISKPHHQEKSAAADSPLIPTQQNHKGSEASGTCGRKGQISLKELQPRKQDTWWKRVKIIYLIAGHVIDPLSRN